MRKSVPVGFASIATMSLAKSLSRLPIGFAGCVSVLMKLFRFSAAV
jgi:hypothetical protein